MLCPKCGAGAVHRSHSRGIRERLVKTFSPYRMYRCHQCNWRGWVKTTKEGKKTSIAKTLLIYSVVIVLALLAASLVRSCTLRCDSGNQESQEY